MSDNLDILVLLLLMTGRLIEDYLYSCCGEEAGVGGYDCSGFASIVLMKTADNG